jgi:hypothetical protein
MSLSSSLYAEELPNPLDDIKFITRPTEPAAWLPGGPIPKKYDWLELTSGEWLKGELKTLYNKKLEFDSEELGILTFDWEDIKQIRGRHMHSVYLENGAIVVGVLSIANGKLVVTRGETVLEFDRSHIISFAQGEARESNYWSGRVTLGFNLRKGNTNQLDYSAKANIKRRTARTRMNINYIGTISQVENIETINNHRLSGHHDIFVTRSFYYTPVFAEYFTDPFSNIKHQATIGIGLGYQIIDTSKTDWNVTGGPAYQATQFETVEAGESDKETTLALAAGTSFKTELSKAVDFKVNYSFKFLDKTSGGYTHHTIIALETEFYKSLDIDISFVWDRIENPKTTADGSVPEKNDYRLIFGLGLDF